MSIREHPKKPDHWIIDCRPDGYKGKRERLVFIGTKEQALAVEQSIMRRHVATTPAAPRQISGIYSAWLPYYRANRAARTVDDAVDCWKHLKTTFGQMRPSILTRAIIEQYKARRVQEVKPRTVTKELSYLSSMLKWGAQNDLCDPVPFQIAGFNRKMTAPPKPRPLTPEQITALYMVIEPEYRLPFLLMADTGLRRSEAMQLRRDHVEFAHGVIFVIGKGSKERIVPITTDRLRLELEKHKDRAGWLTVNPKTKKPFLNIRKALLRAAKQVGLEKHLYHHLLRHSFGTNATAAHVDLSALQSIMGHSSAATTQMYQHLAGEYLRSEGQKLNAMVGIHRPHGRSEDGQDSQQE